MYKCSPVCCLEYQGLLPPLPREGRLLTPSYTTRRGSYFKVVKAAAAWHHLIPLVSMLKMRWNSLHGFVMSS